MCIHVCVCVCVCECVSRIYVYVCMICFQFLHSTATHYSDKRTCACALQRGSERKSEV